MGLILLMVAQGWSKPKALSELSSQEVVDFRQKLINASERIIESPTPPPHYLRRRWEWMRTQGKLPQYRDADEDVERLLKDPEKGEMLRSLQRNLWSMLGQGSIDPLYESPQERDQRSAQMDLETRGTPVLPSYTYEFIPAVAPHKRMTSWNHVKEDGSLQVKIGGLTEIKQLAMSELAQCITGPLNRYPSIYTPLTLGRDAWLDVKQFDLTCFRQQCARSGTACFLGVFSLKDWVDFRQPRGIASVSPEQSLITLRSEGDLVLSQDDAGNFYLSATRGNSLRQLTEVVLPISAPSSYFSGSWSSSSEVSSLSPHPDLQLPIFLKREALILSAKLGFDARDSYEELLFKLTDWFRAFSPGTPPQLQGSVYRQLTLSQVGVCRHRSYAFLVTARALGIPTRYVTNQVHAFVEVLDPLNRWRRVDLGGEGVAPESDELTQDFTSSLNRPYTPFQPDDGLPRPKPYLDAIQRANQTQVNLNAQRSSTRSSQVSRHEEPSLGRQLTSSQDQRSATHLQSQRDTSDWTSKERRTQVTEQNTVTGKLAHSTVPNTTKLNDTSSSSVSGKEPHNFQESTTGTSKEISDSDSSGVERLPERSRKSKPHRFSAQGTVDYEEDQPSGALDSLIENPQTQPIKSQTTEFKASETPQPSDEVGGPSEDLDFGEQRRSRCPDQPQLPKSLGDNTASLDTQRVLRSLYQLIEDRARRSGDFTDQPNDLKPQQGAPVIKVKLHKGKMLNRCSWITISGQVKKAQPPRYPPRGSKVLAALQSVSGGYILHGWGTIGRRGRFKFKSQAPLDMNVGSYQLFVYFPEQRGWLSSWSTVK